MINVLKIELHPMFKTDFMPSIGLPQASDARFNTEPTFLPSGIKSLYVPNRQRARADKTHVSPKHTNKLRQLVQAKLSQQPAYPCNPRIMLHLEGGAVYFVALFEIFQARLSVRNHRAKLEQEKFLSAPADALLEEEYWALRVKFDCDRNNCEDWRKQKQRDSGARYIDPPF